MLAKIVGRIRERFRWTVDAQRQPQKQFSKERGEFTKTVRASIVARWQLFLWNWEMAFDFRDSIRLQEPKRWSGFAV